MAIDALHLDLSGVEAEITNLLGSAVRPTRVRAVRARPRERVPFLAWRASDSIRDLDDLPCDSADRIGDVVTLQGTSNRLTGGDGCDRFRLDIALGSLPLSY